MSFKAGDRVEVRVGPDHGGGYSVVTGTVSQLKDNENFLKKALEASPNLFFKDAIESQIKLIEDKACTPLVFAGEVES